MNRSAALLAPVLAMAVTAAAPTPAHAASDRSDDLPLRAVVLDRFSDTVHDDTALGRSADVRRVAYRTPARTDGTMTIRVTWERLGDGDRRGVRPQRTTTIVEAGRGRTWAVVTRNRRGAAELYELEPGVDTPPPMTPELLVVDHEHGARGTTTITVSTEWLPGRRATLRTFSQAGWRHQVLDHTAERLMRVGPRR